MSAERRCAYCWTLIDPERRKDKPRNRYCSDAHEQADARHKAAVRVGRKRALARRYM